MVEGFGSFWTQVSDNFGTNVVRVASPSGKEAKFIVAGATQYRMLWARDLCFSVRGALLVGEEAAVKDSLELFFAHQLPSGVIPRLVDSSHLALRVVGGLVGLSSQLTHRLKPGFFTENGVLAIDGNMLLPWAAFTYVQHTGDKESLMRWYPRAVLAMEHLEKNWVKKGLIVNQPPFADWADSVARTGTIAFTNVLYRLSLRSMKAWAEAMGDEHQTKHFETLEGDAKIAFDRQFFDPGKHVYRTTDQSDQVSAETNFMLISEGLVPERRAFLMLEALRQSALWRPIPGVPVDTPYAKRHKSLLTRFVGIEGYHDRFTWLWITALGALACQKVGEMEESDRILKFTADLVGLDGLVHEVYERKARILKPVRRLLYRAERPFAWSSAMLLEALAYRRQISKAA
jgi:glycogen debranching enzyme